MKNFTSPESTQIKLNLFSVTTSILTPTKASWNLELVSLESVGSSTLKKDSYHTSNALNSLFQPA